MKNSFSEGESFVKTINVCFQLTCFCFLPNLKFSKGAVRYSEMWGNSTTHSLSPQCIEFSRKICFYTVRCNQYFEYSQLYPRIKNKTGAFHWLRPCLLPVVLPSANAIWKITTLWIMSRNLETCKNVYLNELWIKLQPEILQNYAKLK